MIVFIDPFMPCFHPIPSLYNEKLGKLIYDYRPKLLSNQLNLDFLLSTGYVEVPIGCGKCIGCLRKNASDWVCRLAGEMEFYQNENYSKPCSFITLTFRPGELPDDYKTNMHSEYLSKFFKNYNQYRRDRDLEPVKYYAVPEYGEAKGRLHYHAIVFGSDFLGRRNVPVINYRGRTHYITDELSRAWKYGRATTDPTIASCHSLGAICYTANYLKCEKRVLKRFVFKDGEYKTHTDEYNGPRRVKVLRNSSYLGLELFVRRIDQIAKDGYYRIPYTQRVCGIPRYFTKLIKEYRPELVPVLKEAYEKIARYYNMNEANMVAFEYNCLDFMKNHIQPLHQEEYQDISALPAELSAA